MLELNRQTQFSGQRSLLTSLAHSEAEVLWAQRMRYKVFAEEMGVNLHNTSEGIDRYAKLFLEISKQFLKTPSGKPSSNE